MKQSNVAELAGLDIDPLETNQHVEAPCPLTAEPFLLIFCFNDLVGRFRRRFFGLKDAGGAPWKNSRLRSEKR